MSGADLHLHSLRSDGTDSPAQLVERAARAGLELIALTDHDTTEGVLEAQAAGRERGIEVVTGIEVSTEFEGSEVHLLGYFFDLDRPELRERWAGQRKARERRIESIVRRLNACGLALTVEEVRAQAGRGSIGRPHVADALVAAGHLSTHEEAWREYLRPGGKAYVERERIPLQEAARLLRRAGGVVSVAHPTLYPELRDLERLAAAGVQAMETTHPEVSPEQAAALSELCSRWGLVETGGSDCHGFRRGGPTLGRFRIPVGAVERLRSAAAPPGAGKE